MTKDQIFETWAPRDGRWSPWVKPVLFSFMNRDSTTTSASIFPGLNISSFAPGTPVVIDLPGAESVAAGMALAAHGWQPIPLFNALPGPSAHDRFSEDVLAGRARPSAPPPVAVEVDSIVAALRDATPALQALHLSPSAPPAFLLDARRGAPGWKPRFDTFDNRSISFPSDFPSADKLREYGITRILLIQEIASPQKDLMHTLRQWQEGGLTIELLNPGESARPQPCPIRNVTKLGLWWMRFVSFFTLPRARRDVFGRMIAASS